MNTNDSDSPVAPNADRKTTSSGAAKSSTPVVYIGTDLYSIVTQHAIAVSFMTGTVVSAAKFTQHLVEHYGQQGVESLSESIKLKQER